MIIFAGDGSDFWVALGRLLERWGYRGVRIFGCSRTRRLPRGAGLIVAEPMDVRLLEMASRRSGRG